MRVNDPDSRAIKARYGVVHWTVVEVDDAAVSTSPTRQGAPIQNDGDVRVTFESPRTGAAGPPLALKRTLDAIGGTSPARPRAAHSSNGSRPSTEGHRPRSSRARSRDPATTTRGADRRRLARGV